MAAVGHFLFIVVGHFVLVSALHLIQNVRLKRFSAILCTIIIIIRLLIFPLLGLHRPAA
jgi:hypothetical protein